MKNSIYTRTALAFLLTLSSFSGFAADSFGENMKEMKKQDSQKAFANKELMKISNKKLKEKMDRVCNADPRKKAEEFKKKEELRLAAEKKKEEEIRLAKEKKAKLEEYSNVKALNARNSNVEKIGTKIKETEAQKVVNQNVEKINPVASVDIIDINQRKDDLRITFGGILDTKGYGKPAILGDKRYNVMPGKSINYFFKNTINSIKGINSIFPEKKGNVGDYSKGMGMISDAILYLRAENKNEDIGLLYGADVQFHVPFTEGKEVSQGMNAARGRSAHIFLSSKYGDLKFGYQFGPEALMRLDATRVATVDGGADSDWFRKVNLEGSTASFPFYVTPRLYTESFSSESEKLSFRMAEKYKKDVINTLPFRAAYYSPNYMGTKFAFSYSPRYDNGLFSVKEITLDPLKGSNGKSVNGVKHKETLRHIGPDYEHIISAGASYEHDFNERNIKVKTSIVGEYGKAKKLNKDKHLYKEFVEYNDLIGINFGTSADYKIDEDQNIKFAASFAYLGKSGQPKGIKKLGDNGEYSKIISDAITSDGKRVKALENEFVGDGKGTIYWTSGAGYQYENVYASLTYFGSRMNNKDMLHDVAFGVQYNLSSSCSKSKFVPYAALHYFMTDEKDLLRDKSENDVPSNKGILLLTGVKFSF